MKIHAFVPVKSLENAKSRLAKNFSSSERINLVLDMLDHVLSVLHSSKFINKTFVVTPDKTIAKFVAKYDVAIILEEKPGYNQSLTYAAQKEIQNEKLLTLPADLPLLTTHDINEIYALSQKYDIVLTPSKDNGTNAVFMKFPMQLPYLFGKNSFEKYREAAKKKNLTVGIYRSKTIAFDIDTIEDFKKLQEIKLNALSY